MSVVEEEQLARWATGERATLLQFSTAFCAPCRMTRHILTEVAAVVPGVVHTELDAEAHLDLVRAAAVTSTPTTLILGADGLEVSRARGAPRRDEVIAALARSLPVSPATGPLRLEAP